MVIVPYGAPAVRAAFGFSLIGHPGSLQEVAAIAATNLRFVAAIHLAAFARGRLAGTHRLPTMIVDAAILALIVVNAALPGLALGAYGLAALPFLAHLPVEWLAIARSLAVYLDSGQRPRLTLTALVVLAGALVESFLTPQ